MTNYFVIFVLFFSISSRADELGCEVANSLLPEEINKLAEVFSQDSLKFSLKPDGTFNLQLNIDFPPEMNPLDILKMYTDPKTVISNNNLIKELTYEQGSKIKSPLVCNKPEAVLSKSCKHGVCAETKSNCFFPTVKDSHAQYSCKIDTTHKATNNLFNFGSTQYTCSKSKLSTSCSFVIEGKPKPQGILMLKRSSRQLAVGGAVETALGHLKIALPHALDKALILKTFQKTKYDFYINGTELIESQSDKTINIVYKKN